MGGKCHIEKQASMSHQKLQHLTTTKVFELPYMDLMRPMQVEILGGKRYVLVCVDDFSRLTWISFIRQELDIAQILEDLWQRHQKEKQNDIIRIRSGYDKEFENVKSNEF